nr:alanine racemase [Microlunatus panaciterrae]
MTASAEIDLDAFAANVDTLRAHVHPAAMMIVVKAEGYGHGLLPIAAAARERGIEWLGAATPAEALALREGGDTGRVLTWLYGPDTDLTPLVAADIDVSAQSEEQIARLVAAAGTVERVARVHLKVDTGLSRNGATVDDWPRVCAAAVEAEETGAVEVVGVWSHFAASDEPGHPSVAAQLQVFRAACEVAEEIGVRPRVRHLANSAAALLLPEAHFDLVRVGIAAYGVEPAPGLATLAGIQLQPVMRLRAQLANVKQIAAGTGVSYGHTWVADRATTVGLVPLGYADGVPRHASDLASVGLDGRRVPVRGRICMDQFVVELGPESTAKVGDEVVLFGSGSGGEPTAQDWAAVCDTIGYEIVTRIGARVPRVYVARVDVEGVG